MDLVSTPFHFLSLGAGVQSSTLALMAACGEVTPKFDAAIFADTQAEPKSVYTWLDWLEAEINRLPCPFPIHRISKGSLTETALKFRMRRDGTGPYTQSVIPVYTLEQNGKKGKMKRVCTYDWKVDQLIKQQRKIANIKRGQKEITVTVSMGISRDEIQRIKDSRVPWAQHRYPLIEMRMRREDCLEWMDAKGYPQPPRSACKYCPLHSDSEWLRLKTEEPDEFLEAVKFDHDLRAAKSKTDNMRGVPFLHSSRVPLDQVDFNARQVGKDIGSIQ